MKKVFLFAAVAVMASGFVSCKKCKDCSIDILGASSDTQEFCDDELDAAEANPLLNCE